MSSKEAKKLLAKDKITGIPNPGDADNSSQPNTFLTNLDKVDEDRSNKEEIEPSIAEKERLGDKG